MSQWNNDGLHHSDRKNKKNFTLPNRPVFCSNLKSCCLMFMYSVLKSFKYYYTEHNRDAIF